MTKPTWTRNGKPKTYTSPKLMFTLNQAIFPGALSAKEFRILYSYMVALDILLQKDLAK